MCGIAAIAKISEKGCPGGILDAMRDEVAYRGPDDKGSVLLDKHSGCWRECSPQSGHWSVGLSHRRLSILDLSSSGHQPMKYGQKYWIVYNGEVYNYIELREELGRLGHHFRSASDTEVVLAAYAEWGVGCFQRLRGMWGMVIFDGNRNELILSRDRLGIKPLYMWIGEGLIGVASEIKQFTHVPGFIPRLNHEAATEYLQTSYEDPTKSFFSGVTPLKPGCWARIHLHNLKVDSSESFWDPEKIPIAVTNSEEAGRLFSKKFQESVDLHLRSDVPVGCALSGGLDSSSIVSLVDGKPSESQKTLHTFTSTFPGYQLDERKYVDAVLETIDAESHFVTPDPRQFMEEIDRFLWVHDEPVGSFSMYAGYCVARLTREAGVPVSLNGQGGDEIFSGYWQTYFMHLLDIFRKRKFGNLIDHFGGALLGQGNPLLVALIPFMLKRYLARRKPMMNVRIQSNSGRDPGQVVQKIMSMGEQERRIHEVRVMFLPQLLKWEDRNSMAFSVEGRYPFLDHELIELCLSFSPETLYKRGWTKYPLRVGLKNVLPHKILHRRSKFGFETPQGAWLSNQLEPVMKGWLKQDRPIWDILPKDQVAACLGKVRTRNGTNNEASLDLFRIFVFDRWMSVFNLQL